VLAETRQMHVPDRMISTRKAIMCAVCPVVPAAGSGRLLGQSRETKEHIWHQKLWLAPPMVPQRFLMIIVRRGVGLS
jgi:hypothetical protein